MRNLRVAQPVTVAFCLENRERVHRTLQNSNGNKLYSRHAPVLRASTTCAAPNGTFIALASRLLHSAEARRPRREFIVLLFQRQLFETAKRTNATPPRTPSARCSSSSSVRRRTDQITEPVNPTQRFPILHGLSYHWHAPRFIRD